MQLMGPLHEWVDGLAQSFLILADRYISLDT